MSKNQKCLQTLKNIIGEELYQLTLETFAGQKLLFPKDPDFDKKADRNKQIVSEYYSGVRVPELMERYNLSDAQIYRIIERVS